MKNLTLIAAKGKNNELGKDNQLLWHLKGDMKFFKENTINKPIVMGINTFYSLPKLLTDRKHIVLTHQNIDLGNEVEIFHDKRELLKYLKELKQEVMIIGGASIYSQFIDIADKMLLTEINKSFDADCFFPRFNVEDWNLKELSTNHENGMDYKHLVYTKKH